MGENSEVWLVGIQSWLPSMKQRQRNGYTAARIIWEWGRQINIKFPKAPAICPSNNPNIIIVMKGLLGLRDC